MRTFKGIVAASIIQPGAGAEKIKKPIGKAKIRKTFQPASKSTHPASTGIAEATSKNQMSWLRDSTKTTRPKRSTDQPQTGDGETVAVRSFSRDCHASQAAAAMIRGPCPSCSVCHGPCASLTKVGT